jgi:hypothetical protein
MDSFLSTLFASRLADADSFSGHKGKTDPSARRLMQSTKEMIGLLVYRFWTWEHAPAGGIREPSIKDSR